MRNSEDPEQKTSNRNAKVSHIISHLKNKMAHLSKSKVYTLSRLNKIPLKFSPSPDGIPPYFYNLCAASLAVPLTKIFCASISQGLLPLDWKKGFVMPVYKNGSRLNPDNYRPITISPTPGKILDSIIKDKLFLYLDTHSLLSDFQHGLEGIVLALLIYYVLIT